MRNDPLRPQPKPRRELDEPYLDYIRGSQCVGLYLLSMKDIVAHYVMCEFLLTGRSEANHIRKALFTGMGTKPSDKGFTLPFCNILHNLYTRLGHLEFMKRFRLENQTLFGEMKRLERIYDKQHPKILRKPRLKSATLKIVGICSKGHSTKIPQGQLGSVVHTARFWCVRCQKNQDVG